MNRVQLRVFVPLLAVTALLVGAASRGEEAKVVVQVDQPGVRVSPTLWGIFFEDINCSADGGIYAELVHKTETLRGRKILR